MKTSWFGHILCGFPKLYFLSEICALRITRLAKSLSSRGRKKNWSSSFNNIRAPPPPECLQYGLPFKIDYHKKIQNGLPFQIIIRKVVYFEDINCLKWTTITTIYFFFCFLCCACQQMPLLPASLYIYYKEVMQKKPLDFILWDNKYKYSFQSS